MIGFEHHWIEWTEKMASPWANWSLSMVLTKDKTVTSNWYNTPLHCPSEGQLSFLSCFHGPVEGCFLYISHNFLLTIPAGSDWALSPLPPWAFMGHCLHWWSMSPFCNLDIANLTQFFIEDEQEKFLQHAHMHQDYTRSHLKRPPSGHLTKSSQF
jgi:hypothetical protein